MDVSKERRKQYLCNEYNNKYWYTWAMGGDYTSKEPSIRGWYLLQVNSQCVFHTPGSYLHKVDVKVTQQPAYNWTVDFKSILTIFNL